MDTSVKPDEEEEFADSSSDSSILSEEWQDLSKSDFAKVIFCDMNYDAEKNTVGCKFQITDNVHEDPCDYVGLFKIGKSQCLVSKMLYETECELDGKTLRCNFSDNGLPDGYYHFQYVTRDGEVCGASTPVEVKRLQPKEGPLDENVETAEKEFFPQADLKEDSSDEDVVTENAENDFVVVEHILEKKNKMLEELLEKFRAKNLALSSDMEVLLEAKSKLCQEKEEVIELLHKEILSLKAEFASKESTIIEKDNEIKNLTLRSQSAERTMMQCRMDLIAIKKLLNECEKDKLGLHNEVQLLKEVIKEKENLPAEPEQRILLEQLDDQKFMIRALEDSKQLALKEMSDLSESLSKRTKVLNQTRSELASCKLKLKESDSVVEKQKVHIEKLVKKVDELNSFEKARQQASHDEKPACRNKDEIDLSKPVQELYAIAVARAEKFLVLVDTLIEKTDFYDYFQEKAFHRLKIMFFVLMGKMKKPRELIRSVHSSPERNDVKKPVPRMLPSHQGQTSSDSADVNNLNPTVEPVQKEASAAIPMNIPKAGDSSQASESSKKPLKYKYLSHDSHKLNFNKINELLKAGIPNVKEEDLELFKKLWDNHNDRPKCILEGITTTGADLDDFINVLMATSTRLEMIKLKPVFDAVEREILKNDGQSSENELFLEVLKASMNLENLIRYVEKYDKEACFEEKEKLKKQYEKLRVDATDLSKSVVYLTAKVEDLSSQLMESGASILKLKAELAKKDDTIDSISEHKIDLMERELTLHGMLKGHEARIKEAAELYKTMYLEMDKLKKKLRKSKSKYAAQESSTAEDLSPLKSHELGDLPFKRPRKITSKSSPKLAEKTAGAKALDQQPQVMVVRAADKQPQMLKEISLKSFSQNAEKTCSKICKKASKVHKKNTAADSKTSSTLEALIREKFPINLDTICPAFATHQPECLLPEVDKELTFPNLQECVPPSKGKHPRKTTPTKFAKAATRCVSDCDTGEHVSRNTTVPPVEGDKPVEKKQTPVAVNSKLIETLSDEKPTISPIMEYFKSLDKASLKLDMPMEPGNRDLKNVHKLIGEELKKAFSPARRNEGKSHDIPCVMCDKTLTVTKDLSTLMDHLELDHQISMCPVCGALFEASFPKQYLMFHVEDHFKNETVK